MFRELHANNTDAVGIARLYRKNMPSDLKQRIHRGETVVRYSSDMVALKWMDRKEVTVLSTFHGADMPAIHTHRGEKKKPNAALMYNTNMGRVDLADQMVAAYLAKGTRYGTRNNSDIC